MGNSQQHAGGRFWDRVMQRWLRPHRVYLISTIHLAVFAFSYWLAYWIRFDFGIPAEFWGLYGLTVPWVVALKLNVFYMAGHCSGWRYLTFSDLMVLFRAAAISSILIAVINHLLIGTAVSIPRSIILLDGAMGVLLLGGIRCLFRLSRNYPLPRKQLRRAVIVGADDSGVALAQHIQAEPSLNYRIVGFLDSDVASAGARLGHIPVLGGLDAVTHLASAHAVQEVLVVAGRLAGNNLRYLLEKCTESQLTVKVIPAFGQLLRDGNGPSGSNGKHHIHIRDVEINDLLRREPVELDGEAIASAVEAQTLLVTGAGGCIGGEICRQLLRFKPAMLVLVERAENSLFQIHRELAAMSTATQLVACVADVLDRRRMAEIFERHRPTIVFHAAAHKHVPLMESNVSEAIRNNAFGTRRVALLADRFGVQAFVFISTDKAVNPSSVMGATKQIAERFVHTLASESPMKCVVVRFGNVLGSTGSVVPIFQEQIRQGGPITVTHPDMQRYFMTVPEASQLVLQALAIGKGGEIFELEMGPPVKIVDLARDMIRLSGLPPEAIPITFSGPRPGEKLFEELYCDDEQSLPTSHPKLRAAYHPPFDPSEVEGLFTQLAYCLREPEHVMKRHLLDLVATTRRRTGEHPKPLLSEPMLGDRLIITSRFAGE